MMLRWRRKKGKKQSDIEIDQENIKTEVLGQIPKTRMQEYEEEPGKTVLLNPSLPLPSSVRICAVTLIGGRSCQQDTIWYEGRKDDVAAIVCDGMGGLESGEAASACAVSKFMECYREEEIPVRNVPSFYYHTMQKMNRAVCDLKDENGKPLECGTTAVSVYIYRDRLFWFSIGDSKIYLVRDGKMVCPFEPHNYRMQLEQYLEEGAMSRKKYQEEMALGGALTSFLGIGQISIFEIAREPFLLRKGDRVILCSDGLYKALNENQIMNILEMCRDEFSNTADLFVQAVRDFGKKPLDNVSVVCIAFEGGEAEE